MENQNRLKRSLQFVGTNFLKPASWLCSAIGFTTLFFILTSHLGWVNFALRPADTDLTAEIFVSKAEEFWSAAHHFADIDGHLLIEMDGQTVLSKSFGNADSRSALPILQSSTFHIGSLTKQFTAAAILKLEEEGRLQTAWPVCRVLSHYCEGKLADITIAQLLSHTSGLGSIPLSLKGFLATMMNMWTPFSLEDYVNFQSPTRLNAIPGKSFSYSNFGYDTLSLIVERVTNQSFQSAMDQIFNNNGLARTWIVDSSPRLRRPDTNGSINIRVPLSKTTFKLSLDFLGFDHAGTFGSGAAISSAEDMARWGHLLMSGGFLGEQSQLKMWTPAIDGYAAGWIVRKHEVTGKTLYWHNGRVPGYSSSMALYPEQKIVVVWLSNTFPSNKDEKQIFADFDQLLFGKSYKLPTGRRKIPKLRL